MQTNRKKNSYRAISPSFVVLLSIIYCLFQVSDVHAHRVYLHAWQEGDTVHTESYFGDKKVIKGTVHVFDLSGKELLKGITDEQGLFSFPAPKTNGLRITLNAGMGHGAEYLFKPDKKATLNVRSNKKISNEPIHDDSMMTHKEIKKWLENLDTTLNSISRRLVEIEKKKGPGFTEILGGIGYIFGIMGLALYFKGRSFVNETNKKEKKE